MRNPLPLISGKRNLLILTHKNADLDALGSAIIVAEAFHGRIICPAGPSKAAAEAAEKLGIEIFEELPPSEEFDATVIVDTSDPYQIEPFALGALPRPLVLFDHHVPKPEMQQAADCAVVDEGRKSCAEVVLDYVAPMTRRARVAAMMAIVADTRHLSLARLPTIRKIVELSVDDGCFDEAYELCYFRPDYSQRVATMKAMRNLEFEKIGDELIIARTRAGSFESAIANSLVGMGADVALVSTEKKDEVRVAARAAGRLKERLHLGQVLRKLGGGGHAGAALVSFPAGTRPEEALESAANLIKEVLVPR